MKGNEKLVGHLNVRLTEEMTSISQYMVHAKMCDSWGYKCLADVIKNRAMGEMMHAEKLIARILLLEGFPVVSGLNKLHIGSEVPKMHVNDYDAEEESIQGYNESIRLATEVGDNGTCQLFQEILKDEENHIDWIEGQLDQIKQVGPQNYLTEQIYRK